MALSFDVSYCRLTVAWKRNDPVPIIPTPTSGSCSQAGIPFLREDQSPKPAMQRNGIFERVLMNSATYLCGGTAQE